MFNQAIGRSNAETILLQGKTYTVVKKIGEGAFSNVYFCQCYVEGGAGRGEDGVPSQVAIKRSAVPPDKVISVQEDIALLESLQHKNITKFYALEVARVHGHYSFLAAMEYCPNSVFARMQQLSQQKQFFPVKELMSIFFSMCNAVQYLHSLNPPMSHRDIKPENVLQTQLGHYKLCDFGSMTSVGFELLNSRDANVVIEECENATTLLYRAPEMIDPWQYKKVNQQVDVWALGIFLYYLMYLKFPFEETKLAILNGRYSFPANPPYPDVMVEIVKRCLVSDPCKRWTVFDVTAFLSTHPEIQQMNIDPTLLEVCQSPGNEQPIRPSNSPAKPSVASDSPIQSQPPFVSSGAPKGGGALFGMLDWSSGTGASQPEATSAPPPQVPVQAKQEDTAKKTHRLSDLFQFDAQPVVVEQKQVVKTESPVNSSVPTVKSDLDDLFKVTAESQQTSSPSGGTDLFSQWDNPPSASAKGNDVDLFVVEEKNSTGKAEKKTNVNIDDIMSGFSDGPGLTQHHQ